MQRKPSLSSVLLLAGLLLFQGLAPDLQAQLPPPPTAGCRDRIACARAATQICAQGGRSKTMSGRQRSVQVYIDTAGPVLMGTLYAQSGGSQEIFSFEYDPEWLGREQAFAFDPDLQLLGGPQYPGQARNNFGIFLDSSLTTCVTTGSLWRNAEAICSCSDGRIPRALASLRHVFPT